MIVKIKKSERASYRRDGEGTWFVIEREGCQKTPDGLRTWQMERDDGKERATLYANPKNGHLFVASAWGGWFRSGDDVQIVCREPTHWTA